MINKRTDTRLRRTRVRFPAWNRSLSASLEHRIRHGEGGYSALDKPARQAPKYHERTCRLHTRLRQTSTATTCRSVRRCSLLVPRHDPRPCQVRLARLTCRHFPCCESSTLRVRPVDDGRGGAAAPAARPACRIIPATPRRGRPFDCAHAFAGSGFRSHFLKPHKKEDIPF